MMKCIIASLEGSSFEIDVSSCAKGDECLVKACQAIGVIEIDYFGLQYSGPQGESLWLNSRNPLLNQVSGTAPHRFLLRVKFFVPPHLLLQESCRHQFFLQARADFEAHRLTSASTELYQQAAAAVERCRCCPHCGSARSTHGSLDIPKHASPSSSTAASSCCSSPAAAPSVSCAAVTAAAAVPSTAAVAGLELLASLEYAALKLLAQLDGYGYEWHQAAIVDRIEAPAADRFVADRLVEVAVASEGILLYTAIDTCMIPFATVSKVTQKHHVLDVEHRFDGLAGGIGSNGSSTNVLLLDLATNLACGALYRSITERHCFYRCDTVRSVVTDQYSLDLKGALWSLLHSPSSLWGSAKDFCFDVQRTSREAYDCARRKLFNAGAITSTFQLPPLHSSAAAGDLSDNGCRTAYSSADAEANGCDGDTCCICLEGAAVVRFAPCLHRTCCHACSLAVDRCPICRSTIHRRQLDSCC